MKNLPPLVSIIVPIYNVSDFINKSLGAIEQQTWKNIEVIMVNDGSTDNSASIAQKFVERDTRFNLFHQENKGLSGARNTGLKQVNGDYVLYLDSDDYLVENAIELLVHAAIKYHSDVVQGNFYYDYQNYLLLNQQQKQEVKNYNRNQAMWALLEHKTVLNFAWGKLIKTELAKAFEFPEGKFFEDTFWISQIIHNVSKYTALKTPILFYLQRNESISGNFSMRNLDQLELEIKRLNFIKNNYPIDYFKKALASLNQKVMQHQKLLNFLEQQDAEKYQNKLNEIEKDYSLMKYFSKEYKFVYQKIKLFRNRITQIHLINKKFKKIKKQ